MEEFATLDRALISSFRAMFGDWAPWQATKNLLSDAQWKVM